MASPPDEPVLSEVHMESCPPNTTCWCTRFCYSLPQQHQPQSDSKQSCLSAAPAAAATSPAVAGQQALKSLTAVSDEHATESTDSDLNVDADGDLLLLDRPERRSQHISIQHSLATPVSRCGEQVWLGSCLLCDWLVHNAQQLAGQTVLELGAGVGLASIMAARFAQTVLLTDADAGALGLAVCNVRANGVQERAFVRRLDWLQVFDTQLCLCSDAEVLSLLNSTSVSSSSSSNSGTARTVPSVHQAADVDSVGGLRCQQLQQQLPGISSSSYDWVSADLQQLCAVDIWLAADVVYNETLTDAFMRTAHQLMTWQQQQRRQQQQQPQQQAHHQQEPLRNYARCPPEGNTRHSGQGSCAPQLPRLLVAAEKRYNFSYKDLDATASAFEHFMTYVVAGPAATAAASTDTSCQQHVQQHAPEGQQQLQAQPDRAGLGIPNGHVIMDSKPLFSGRQLSMHELPQAMVYDRSPDLELWELLPLLPTSG